MTIGRTELRDFDLGLVTTLGAVEYVRTMPASEGGGTRTEYVLELAGVTGPPEYEGKVPVRIVIGEDAFNKHVYPSVTIRRGDIEWNFNRAPTYGYDRIAPVEEIPGEDPGDPPIQEGAEIVEVEDNDGVTVEGPDALSIRKMSLPADIAYEVHVLARTRAHAALMFKAMIKKMKPPWFIVTVVDDAGDNTTWDAGEVQTSDTSELVDIADRVIGWTFSFSIRGALLADDDVDVKTVTGRVEMTGEAI